VILAMIGRDDARDRGRCSPGQKRPGGRRRPSTEVNRRRRRQQRRNADPRTAVVDEQRTQAVQQTGINPPGSPVALLRRGPPQGGQVRPVAQEKTAGVDRTADQHAEQADSEHASRTVETLHGVIASAAIRTGARSR
jgi:hypothetical protein